MKIDSIINSSLGVLETFEDSLLLLANYIEFIEDEDKKTAAEQQLNKLESILNIIKDSFNPIELSDKVRLSGYKYKSIIYDLGIAGDLIRLREANTTMKDIADRYNIKYTTVTSFFKHFDTLAQVEKAKVKAASVMNTTERLEDLMNMCLRQLHRLEGVNDDVHVKYIGELRQTFGLAAQVSEKIATYKAYEDFKTKVRQILIDELPDRKLEIINKLKAITADETAKALPAHLGSR